jgi:mannose-6-phosphate isomerase-like protein (cupin superfamily)
MKLGIAIAVMMLSVSAFGQSADKAEVFTSGQIQSQLTQLAPAARDKGSSGATLGDYKCHSLKLSVRTTSGGAEIHAHFDDVMVVTQGNATLITGGTVVDPKTGSDGETKGASIKDGVTQGISTGDIVHVPAGTPHQLLIPQGTTFSAFVVKVRE